MSDDVVLCRLGGGEEDVKDIMRHPFFETIDWQALYEKRVSTLKSFPSSSYMQYVLCECVCNGHPCCAVSVKCLWLAVLRSWQGFCRNFGCRRP